MLGKCWKREDLVRKLMRFTERTTWTLVFLQSGGENRNVNGKAEDMWRRDGTVTWSTRKQYSIQAKVVVFTHFLTFLYVKPCFLWSAPLHSWPFYLFWFLCIICLFLYLLFNFKSGVKYLLYITDVDTRCIVYITQRLLCPPMWLNISFYFPVFKKKRKIHSLNSSILFDG